MQHLVIVLLVFTGFYAQAGDVLRIRLSGAPRTLDWSIATSGSEAAIIQNVMRGLFELDQHGAPVPDLAESFTWSSDRRTLLVKLKPKVFWRDGAPLKGAHFVDEMMRVLDPKANSENASLFFDLKGARDYFFGKLKTFSAVGVSSPSPGEVRFELNEPKTNFIKVLSHWASYPVRTEKPKLTLGPFAIDELSKTRVTLHPTQQKNLPLVEFHVIQQGSIALQKFKQKKINFLLQVEETLPLTPSDLERMDAKLGFAEPTRVVALLHFNPNRETTNTPEKRVGMIDALALDQLISKGPKSRLGADLIIPPSAMNRVNSAAKPKWGASTSPLNGTSVVLGVPPDAYSESLARELALNSTQVRIKVETLPVRQVKNVTEKYDLILSLYGLDYGDPDQLLSTFLSQGTHDYFNSNNIDLLRILREARAAPSPLEQNRLFESASDLLQYKRAMVVPLFYRKRPYLVHSKICFDPGFSGSPQIQHIRMNCK